MNRKKYIKKGKMKKEKFELVSKKFKKTQITKVIMTAVITLILQIPPIKAGNSFKEVKRELMRLKKLSNKNSKEKIKFQRNFFEKAQIPKRKEKIKKIDKIPLKNNKEMNKPPQYTLQSKNIDIWQLTVSKKLQVSQPQQNQKLHQNQKKSKKYKKISKKIKNFKNYPARSTEIKEFSLPKPPVVKFSRLPITSYKSLRVDDTTYHKLSEFTKQSTDLDSFIYFSKDKDIANFSNLVHPALENIKPHSCHSSGLKLHNYTKAYTKVKNEISQIKVGIACFDTFNNVLSIFLSDISPGDFKIDLSDGPVFNCSFDKDISDKYLEIVEEENYEKFEKNEHFLESYFVSNLQKREGDKKYSIYVYQIKPRLKNPTKCDFDKIKFEIEKGFDTKEKTVIEKYGNIFVIKPRFDERFLILNNKEFPYDEKRRTSFLLYLETKKIENFLIDSFKKIKGLIRVHSYSISTFNGKMKEKPKLILIGSKIIKGGLIAQKGVELYQVQEKIKATPRPKKPGEEDLVYVDKKKNFIYTPYLELTKIQMNIALDPKYVYFTWIRNETLYIFSHFRNNFLVRIFECPVNNFQKCQILDQIRVLSELDERRFYMVLNSKKLNSISFDFYDQENGYGYTMSLFIEHLTKTQKKVYSDFTQKSFFTQVHYSFYRHYFPFQAEMYTVLTTKKLVILDQTLQAGEKLKFTHDRITREISLIFNSENYSEEFDDSAFKKNPFAIQIFKFYSVRSFPMEITQQEYGVKLYNNCFSSMKLMIKQNPLLVSLSVGGNKLIPFIGRKAFSGSLLDLSVESYAGGIKYFIEKSNKLEFKVLQTQRDFTIVDHTFFTSVGIFGVTDKIKMFFLRCTEKKLGEGSVVLKECKKQRFIIDVKQFYKKDVVSYVETSSLYVIFRCDALYSDYDTLFFISKANYKVSHLSYNHDYENFDAFDYQGRLFFIYYSETKGLKVMTNFINDNDKEVFKLQEIEKVKRHKEFLDSIKCVRSVSRFGDIENNDSQSTSVVKVFYKVKEFCTNTPNAKNRLFTLVFSYDRTIKNSKIYLGVDQIQEVFSGEKDSQLKKLNYCLVKNSNYLIYGKEKVGLKNKIILRGDNINLEESNMQYDKNEFNIDEFMKVLCFKESNFATVVAKVKKFDSKGKFLKFKTGVLTLDLAAKTFRSRLFDYYELDFIPKNPVQDIFGFEEDPGRILIIQIKNFRKYERRRIVLNGPRLHVITWEETSNEYNARLNVFNRYEKKQFDFILTFSDPSDSVDIKLDRRQPFEPVKERLVRPLSNFLSVQGSLIEAKIIIPTGGSTDKVNFPSKRIMPWSKEPKLKFKEDDLFTYCYNSKTKKNFIITLCYTPNKSNLKILHLNFGQIFEKKIDLRIRNAVFFRHLELSNLLVVVLFEIVTTRENCIPLILVVELTSNLAAEKKKNYFLRGVKSETRGIEPPHDLNIFLDTDSRRKAVNLVLVMLDPDKEAKGKYIPLSTMKLYSISIPLEVLSRSQIKSYKYEYLKGAYRREKCSKLFKVRLKQLTIIDQIMETLNRQRVFLFRPNTDGSMDLRTTIYKKKEKGKELKLYELEIENFRLNSIPDFIYSDCLELSSSTFGCVFYNPPNQESFFEIRFSYKIRTVTKKREGKEDLKEDVLFLTKMDRDFQYDKHSKSVEYIKIVYGRKYIGVLALYDEKQIKNSKILIYKKQDQGGSQHVFYSLPIFEFMTRTNYYSYINFFFRVVNNEELLCVYDMDEGKILHFSIGNFELNLAGKKISEFKGYKIHFENLVDKKDIPIPSLFVGDKEEEIKPPPSNIGTPPKKKDDFDDIFMMTMILFTVAILILIFCVICVVRERSKMKMVNEKQRILNFVYDLTEFQFDETYF